MNFSPFYAQLAVGAEWLRAGAMAGVFFVLAILVALFWTKTVGRLAERTPSSLDDLILKSVRSLVLWALVLGGIYSAVNEISLLHPESSIWSVVTKSLTTLWILLAVYTINKMSKAFARWKISQVAEQSGHDLRDVATRVTFFRKVFTIAVVSIAALIILSQSGVNTTPLLTGGAVGGIVLGIALQDTLSNVFAGFFLNIDRPVKIGDLIRIEDKYEGNVEDVGWRYTRLRLKSRDLVIIPNNKLSQSTMVNIKATSENPTVDVQCVVGAGNDLDRIEQIVLEIAKKAQASDDGFEEGWVPKVRFKTVGESTVNFVTTLRATDDEALGRVQHEFIKLLHKRLKQNGIDTMTPLSNVAITTTQ